MRDGTRQLPCCQSRSFSAIVRKLANADGLHSGIGVQWNVRPVQVVQETLLSVGPRLLLRTSPPRLPRGDLQVWWIHSCHCVCRSGTLLQLHCVVVVGHCSCGGSPFVGATEKKNPNGREDFHFGPRFQSHPKRGQ